MYDFQNAGLGPCGDNGSGRCNNENPCRPFAAADESDDHGQHDDVDHVLSERQIVHPVPDGLQRNHRHQVIDARDGLPENRQQNRQARRVQQLRSVCRQAEMHASILATRSREAQTDQAAFARPIGSQRDLHWRRLGAVASNGDYFISRRRQGSDLPASAPRRAADSMTICDKFVNICRSL